MVMQKSQAIKRNYPMNSQANRTMTQLTASKQANDILNSTSLDQNKELCYQSLLNIQSSEAGVTLTVSPRTLAKRNSTAAESFHHSRRSTKGRHCSTPLVHLKQGQVEEINIEEVPRHVYVSSNMKTRVIGDLQNNLKKTNIIRKNYAPRFVNLPSNEYSRKLQQLDKKGVLDENQTADILKFFVEDKIRSQNMTKGS